MKKLAKKLAASVTAATLGVSLIFSAPTAEAFSLGDAINIGGAVISANQQMAQLKKEIDVLDKTEEGRQALFQSFREKYGVVEDYELNQRLDTIVANLTEAVAKVDPTIKDKPYLYFVANQESVNAACGIGHVMMVHSGTFKFFSQDDEIAAVVGHEMGHGQKDHVIKGAKSRINQQMIAQIGVSAAGGTTLAGVIGALALTNTVADYGRGKEAEADDLAWEYLLHTNYNLGATAAAQQRFVEAGYGKKQSGLASLFNPSDHPNSEKRRDNYAKKLFEYSNKHAEVDKKTFKVIINKKDFVLPVATSSMSAAERAYFVLGNLAAAYHKGLDKEQAYASNGTVYLGSQAIMTPASGDEDAETLAARLNEIK